jgi:hypothetical protein
VAQLHKLRARGKVEPSPHLSVAASGAVTAYERTLAAYEDARRTAAAVFERERERCVTVLKAVGSDPRFREAMVWQNRHALHTGVDALIRHSPSVANAKSRGHERLVASTLQRYCVKNDSISFFGPVGWATIDEDATPIAVRPGAAFVDSRSVYFEHWAIDALAAKLAADPSLRPHLAPRRHPTMWIDGTTLRFPLNRQIELPLEFARVLAACDGVKSAHSIAMNVLQDPELGLGSEDDVYELLEEMVSKKMVIWTLEIPIHVEHPDRTLASLLERVDAPEVAAPGLAASPSCTSHATVWPRPPVIQWRSIARSRSSTRRSPSTRGRRPCAAPARRTRDEHSSTRTVDATST